jgi:hypothetical protein
MMPRRRLDHVSPVDLGWIDTEEFDQIFYGLSDLEVTVVCAVICAGVPVAIVARELGMSPVKVRLTCSRAMSRLRFPTRSTLIRAFLDDDWQDRIRSHGLRAKVETWVKYQPRCLKCGSQMEVPLSYWYDMGRPRKYCSTSCKQAAYRDRKRAAT